MSFSDEPEKTTGRFVKPAIIILVLSVLFAVIYFMLPGVMPKSKHSIVGVEEAQEMARQIYLTVNDVSSELFYGYDYTNYAVTGSSGTAYVTGTKVTSYDGVYSKDKTDVSICFVNFKAAYVDVTVNNTITLYDYYSSDPFKTSSFRFTGNGVQVSSDTISDTISFSLGVSGQKLSFLEHKYYNGHLIGAEQIKFIFNDGIVTGIE